MNSSFKKILIISLFSYLGCDKNFAAESPFSITQNSSYERVSQGAPETNNYCYTMYQNCNSRTYGRVGEIAVGVVGLVGIGFIMTILIINEVSQAKHYNYDIVNKTPGLVIIDAQGRIVMMNPNVAADLHIQGPLNFLCVSDTQARRTCATSDSLEKYSQWVVHGEDDLSLTPKAKYEAVELGYQSYRDNENIESINTPYYNLRGSLKIDKK